MVRFWGLIAAAISLTSVLADQPNVGYYAEIDPSEVRVDGGPNSDIIYVDAPVTLTLLSGAPKGSYSLTVTVAPYRIIDESYEDTVDETVVYTGSITAGSPVFVSFEVEKKDWKDFLVEAIVQSDESETIIGQAGDTIIAPDENGYWGAIDLSVWVDQINDELVKEIDELPIEFVDEPVDPSDGEEPVRTNPDPKPVRPKEDAPLGNGTVTSPVTPPTTTPGGGDGSVTGPGGSDGGSVTGPGGSDGGSVTRPGPSDGGSGTVTRPSDGNGGGKSTTCPGCGHGDGPRTLITIRKTTTICPTPTPPPPPCPENDKELAARLAERQQAPIFEAYIKAKIQFRDRQKKILPLRGVRVEAEVDVYAGNKFRRKQKSAATTSLKGEGSFRFTIREDERVEVKRLFTILEVKDRWRIGTTKNEVNFKTRKIQLTLNQNPWSINAGGLKTYTNTHSFSKEYRALWVADSIKVITDYALKEVFVPGEQKLVNILYPSTIKAAAGSILAGAFFRGQGSNSFINLANMDAFSPTTLGHEYGHYVQYNSRGEKTMAGQSKDPHYVCEPTIPNPSNELSFKEGFASAFGLMALDQSHLEEGYLISRQGTTVSKLGYGFPYEDYSCADKILLNNEGRIGAALLDLVDRKLDKFDTKTTDKGFIKSGFKGDNLNTRFDPRYIFYLIMKYPPLGALPDNMKDYWYNLQKSLLDEGDKTSEFKAWSIIEYNFGDENHDGFPRNKKK